MPSVNDLLLYMTAVIALNLTPGNDMMFVLSSGLNHGRRAGIAASLGIATGSMMLVVLAAAGLATVVTSTPILFNVIRWGGVIYLLWLAFLVFKESPAGSTSTRISPDSINTGDAQLSVRKAFYRAVMVNFLNPKIILFVLAFIPQFIDPERGSTFVQFLILGGLLNLSGTLINGGVGYFAGELHQHVKSDYWLIRLRYVSAILFILIAVRLAL